MNKEELDYLLKELNKEKIDQVFKELNCLE